MPRPVLEEARIHPAIRDFISQSHRDIVDDVAKAVDQHDIVVVGMAQNPNPKRARKLLDAAGLQHHYLEYGSYFNSWRRRNALKLWTGWPTFPMVFVKRQLIGGADDLEKLLASGEIKKLLGR
ncbi:MAG: glutaredoxin domain-containing protein [Sinimarinibacterium sp.]|jgi:glutaredoxin-related protein